MPKTPYCPSHETRISESGASRFYFDTLVITWIFNNHMNWFERPDWCYLCKVSHDQVTGWIKDAAKMEADVAAGGGSYTTDKMSIFSGGTNDE